MQCEMVLITMCDDYFGREEMLVLVLLPGTPEVEADEVVLDGLLN